MQGQDFLALSNLLFIFLYILLHDSQNATFTTLGLILAMLLPRVGIEYGDKSMK